jgi:hypothetical protein
MIVVRNIAIVALLALAITVLPGGGNVTAAILTTLSLIFIVAIAALIARGWKQTSMTRDSMGERQRLIFYISLGALALMLAGLDEMFETGGGTVAWILIVGAAIYGLVTSWREAESY